MISSIHSIHSSRKNQGRYPVSARKRQVRRCSRTEVHKQHSNHTAPGSFLGKRPSVLLQFHPAHPPSNARSFPPFRQGDSVQLHVMTDVLLHLPLCRSFSPCVRVCDFAPSTARTQASERRKNSPLPLPQSFPCIHPCEKKMVLQNRGPPILQNHFLSASRG